MIDGSVAMLRHVTGANMFDLYKTSASQASKYSFHMDSNDVALASIS